MNKDELVKEVVKGVIGFSVGTVVGNIISYTMPPQTRFISKVLTGIGGFVIAAVISEHCEQYILKEMKLK